MRRRGFWLWSWGRVLGCLGVSVLVCWGVGVLGGWEVKAMGG